MENYYETPKIDFIDIYVEKGFEGTTGGFIEDEEKVEE